MIWGKVTIGSLSLVLSSSTWYSVCVQVYNTCKPKPWCLPTSTPSTASHTPFYCLPYPLLLLPVSPPFLFQATVEFNSKIQVVLQSKYSRQKLVKHSKMLKKCCHTDGAIHWICSDRSKPFQHSKNLFDVCSILSDFTLFHEVTNAVVLIKFGNHSYTYVNS